jgi:hypothetical protein
MTITTRDQIINALANNSSRIVIDKASIANAVAGQIFSLWRATGVPSQAVIPSTAAICTSALTGSFAFTNQTAPATSYIGWLWAATGNAATSIEVHDRLAHMGGLSGTVTTSQGSLNLTGLPAARQGNTNFSDVQWWLEVFTDLGATNVNATVAVTYNDDTTGNLAAVALGATPRAGRMYSLVSASAGKWIKNITGVTLSATTGTAGNFGLTATRPRTVISTAIANKQESFDWAVLGMPEVPNDACLQLVMLCSTTSTGTVRGGGKIMHG